MTSFVILGASGSVGKSILALKNLPLPVKAIARRKPSDTDLSLTHITWYEADLLEAHSLDNILDSGDIVINLAYMTSVPRADNLRMIDNVIHSCVQNKIKKLIHCSTATVVGTAQDSLIDESTPCLPLTEYEQTKYMLEQSILDAAKKGLDVIILRPTAIVGPNGKNLLKLADSLITGNIVINYLRASLFGRRKMHLVSVHNVARALVHLAMRSHSINASIYLISSDDDPDNNFLSVESILRDALGIKPRQWPVFPLPLVFLSILLKLMGRSEFNLARVYDSKKLLETHYTPVVSVSDAVTELGKSILNNPLHT